MIDFYMYPDTVGELPGQAQTASCFLRRKSVEEQFANGIYPGPTSMSLVIGVQYRLEEN